MKELGIQQQYHSCPRQYLSRKQGCSFCYKYIIIVLRVVITISLYYYHRTNSITFASSQKRVPTAVDTPHMSEYTPFASFQAHMLSFRDRFTSTLDQSPPLNALDMSNIYTPVSCLCCTLQSMTCSCECIADHNYIKFTVKTSSGSCNSSFNFERASLL